MPKRREVKIVALLEDMVSSPARRIVKSVQRLDKSFQQVSKNEIIDTTLAQRNLRNLGKALDKAARETRGTKLAENVRQIQQEFNRLSRGPLTRTTGKGIRTLGRQLQNIANEANEAVGPQDRLTRTFREASDAAGTASRSFEVYQGNAQEATQRSSRLRAELDRLASTAQGTSLAGAAQGLQQRLGARLASTPPSRLGPVTEQVGREVESFRGQIGNAPIEEQQSLAVALSRVEEQLRETRTAASQYSTGQRRVSSATVRTRQAIRGISAALARVGQSFGRAALRLSRFRRGIARMPRAILRFTRSMLTLRATIVTTIAALGVARLTRFADAWLTIENRLRLVTESQKEVKTAMDEVFKIAQDTRVEFATVGEIYFRVARGSAAFRKDQERLLGVIRAITQAIQLSGVSAEAARNAMIQFGQGLASQNLGGDELRAVLEQTPRLGFAIAAGLERDGRIGVNFGQLRELGSERELTTSQLLEAIERQSDVLEEEFKNINVTIGQATTKLLSSFTRFIGKTGKLTGITENIAALIVSQAERFDRLTDTVNNTVVPRISALRAVLADTFPQRVARAAAVVTRRTTGVPLDTNRSVDNAIKKATALAEEAQRQAQDAISGFFVGVEGEVKGLLSNVLTLAKETLKAVGEFLISAVLDPFDRRSIVGLLLNELGLVIKESIQEGLSVLAFVPSPTTRADVKAARTQRSDLVALRETLTDNSEDELRRLGLLTPSQRKSFKPTLADIDPRFADFVGPSEQLKAADNETKNAVAILIELDNKINELGAVVAEGASNGRTAAERLTDVGQFVSEEANKMAKGMGDAFNAAVSNIKTDFKKTTDDFVTVNNQVQRVLDSIIERTSPNFRATIDNLLERTGTPRLDRSQLIGSEASRAAAEETAQQTVKEIADQIESLELRQRVAAAQGDTSRAAILETQLKQARELERLVPKSGGIVLEDFNRVRSAQKIELASQRVAVAGGRASDALGELSKSATERIEQLRARVDGGFLGLEEGREREKQIIAEVKEELEKRVEALEQLKKLDPRIAAAVGKRQQELRDEFKENFPEDERGGFGLTDLDGPTAFLKRFRPTLQTAISDFNQFEQLGSRVASTLIDGFRQIGDTIADSIIQAKNFGQAMRQLAGQVVSQVARMVLQFTILRAVSGLFGFAGGVSPAPSPVPVVQTGVGGLPVTGFASGGPVGGRPGRDRNVAALSRGEFVVNADAVRQAGLPFLEALNSRLVPSSLTQSFSAPSRMAATGRRALGMMNEGGQARSGGEKGNVVPALILDGTNGEKLAKLLAPFMIEEMNRFHGPESRALAR